MITIIADTQHIAKQYAKIVGASDEENHYYAGNDYAVTWLEDIHLGLSPELSKALDTLPPMELPMIPEKLPVVLLPQKGHQKSGEKMMNYARILSRLIANSTYVYLATSDLQATLLKGGPMLITIPKGFLFQLCCRSLSAKGIRESIMNRQQIRGVQQKYELAFNKQKADWLVSANATHLLEKVYGKGAHKIDRIATPLLSLICRRYKANKGQKMEAVYQVNFSLERNGEVHRFQSDKRFADVAAANALYVKMRSAIGKKPVIISKVSVNTQKDPSPPLFNYQDVLIAANVKYGFGVIYTTQCLQKLFDFGLITWPFSSKRHIGQSEVREFWNNTVNDLRSDIKWERMILKIAKRDRDCYTEHYGRCGHVGICLTERKYNPYLHKLTQDEQRIYDLVVERMILAFGEDAQINTSTVTAEFDGHQFSFKKSAIKEKGWTAMVNRKIANSYHPVVNHRWNKGDKEHFYGVSITKKGCAAVRLHTAETLLVEADLFDLGTTKEKINAIRMLFEQGYIDTFEKEMVPTEKGLALYSIVRDMIIGSPQHMGYFNRNLAEGPYCKAMVKMYAEAIVRELQASETLFATRIQPISRETREMIEYIKDKA